MRIVFACKYGSPHLLRLSLEVVIARVGFFWCRAARLSSRLVRHPEASRRFAAAVSHQRDVAATPRFDYAAP